MSEKARTGWQQKLDFLLESEVMAVGEAKFAITMQIAECRTKLAELSSVSSSSVEAPPRIDVSHLPAGAEHFFGREVELAVLDAAWADSGRSRVVELVAPGGVGKTSLVKRWLENMGRDGWRGARRVYGWSFYSQGTSHDRQASDDAFLSAALAWFGVELDPATHPWDKGQRLAEAVATSRTLLILDGIEPLQYPPRPAGGRVAGAWPQGLAGMPGQRRPTRSLPAHQPRTSGRSGPVRAQ